MPATSRRARPPSPRVRPAKPALSRESIVAAALALVGEVGYDAVTMRRVAQAVDTGAASLYVYVADRRDLMVEVHDLALAEVALPTGADGDWRARLELLVDRIVTALADHDDIASVGLADVPTGHHALRLSEEMLRLLRSGGINDAACAWAADLLGQYIASSALERAAWLRAQRTLIAAGSSAQATSAAAMSQAFSDKLDAVYDSLPPAEFPTITALRGLLTEGGGDARASWKLRVIIDGLLAQT